MGGSLSVGTQFLSGYEGLSDQLDPSWEVLSTEQKW